MLSHIRRLHSWTWLALQEQGALALQEQVSLEEVRIDLQGVPWVTTERHWQSCLLFQS